MSQDRDPFDDIVEGLELQAQEHPEMTTSSLIEIMGVLSEVNMCLAEFMLQLSAAVEADLDDRPVFSLEQALLLQLVERNARAFCDTVSDDDDDEDDDGDE